MKNVRQPFRKLDETPARVWGLLWQLNCFTWRHNRLPSQDTWFFFKGQLCMWVNNQTEKRFLTLRVPTPAMLLVVFPSAKILRIPPQHSTLEQISRVNICNIPCILLIHQLQHFQIKLPGRAYARWRILPEEISSEHRSINFCLTIAYEPAFVKRDVYIAH